MSVLIDKLIEDINKTQITIKIDGEWYVAKPLEFPSLKGKLKDCIEILKGKAIAVHYKNDEG